MGWHISDRVTIEYKGKPAQLCVIRSDGYCWGRLVTPDGQEFDVSPAGDDDYYDLPDVDAREAFEEAMKADDMVVVPATSGELGWEGDIPDGTAPRRWFALDENGNMVSLGVHESFEAADEACSIQKIWIVPEEIARQWLAQLRDLLEGGLNHGLDDH